MDRSKINWIYTNDNNNSTSQYKTYSQNKPKQSDFPAFKSRALSDVTNSKRENIIDTTFHPNEYKRKYEGHDLININVKSPKMHTSNHSKYVNNLKKIFNEGSDEHKSHFLKFMNMSIVCDMSVQVPQSFTKESKESFINWIKNLGMKECNDGIFKFDSNMTKYVTELKNMSTIDTDTKPSVFFESFSTSSSGEFPRESKINEEILNFNYSADSNIGRHRSATDESSEVSLYSTHPSSRQSPKYLDLSRSGTPIESLTRQMDRGAILSESKHKFYSRRSEDDDQKNMEASSPTNSQKTETDHSDYDQDNDLDKYTENDIQIKSIARIENRIEENIFSLHENNIWGEDTTKKFPTIFDPTHQPNSSNNGFFKLLQPPKDRSISRKGKSQTLPAYPTQSFGSPIPERSSLSQNEHYYSTPQSVFNQFNDSTPASIGCIDRLVEKYKKFLSSDCHSESEACIQIELTRSKSYPPRDTSSSDPSKASYLESILCNNDSLKKIIDTGPIEIKKINLSDASHSLDSNNYISAQSFSEDDNSEEIEDLESQIYEDTFINIRKRTLKRNKKELAKKIRLSSSFSNSFSMDCSRMSDSFHIARNHSCKKVTESNKLASFKFIVGGKFLYCVENGLPIVKFPSCMDDRVVKLNLLSDMTLSLTLYSPLKNQTNLIKLNENWSWIPTRPVGYLVFEFSQDKRMFYLPKFLDNWAGVSLNANMKNILSSKNYLGHAPACHLDYDHENCIFRDIFNVYYHSDNLLSHNGSSLERKPSNLSHSHLDRFASNLYSPSIQNSSPLNCSIHSNGSFCIKKSQSMESLEGYSEEDNPLFTQQSQSFTSDAQSEYSSINDGISARMKCDINILSNILSFLLPESNNYLEEISYLSTVSKFWSLAVAMSVTKKLSLTEHTAASSSWEKYLEFIKKYRVGKYLSEGVCKQVYCVCSPAGKLEAISLMDLEDLQKREIHEAARQEIGLSILCSSLVSSNICPNFVQVYSLFQSPYSAPSSWDLNVSKLTSPKAKSLYDKTKSFPTQDSFENGNFQYIRMELCRGGDLESHLRKLKTIESTRARSYFFQMCFSLFTSREKYCLRHYDIKLLNFFVTHGNSLIAKSQESSKSNLNIKYSVTFGQSEFQIAMKSKDLDLVKLADFGTSVFGDDTLGDLIGPQQFTTLENSPPEYLIQGAKARQCYSADTFCLGLCFLHLLTGYAPYEELLSSVVCPEYLKSRIKIHWSNKDKQNQYSLINEVMDSLEFNDLTKEDKEKLENVLYDTLYRYCVLLGDSDSFKDPFLNQMYEKDPVWEELSTTLLQSKSSGKIVTSKQSKCMKQFADDKEEWSIRNGSNQIVQNARKLMDELGGGCIELLEALLHFNPSKRLPMRDVLLHPIFYELKQSNLKQPLNNKSSITVQYSHYFDKDDNLPFL